MNKFIFNLLIATFSFLPIMIGAEMLEESVNNAALPFTVELKTHKRNTSMIVRSKVDQPEEGRLYVVAANLLRPVDTTNGTIDITLDFISDVVPQVVGPQYAYIRLGRENPNRGYGRGRIFSFPAGTYDLQINGQSYGPMTLE